MAQTAAALAGEVSTRSHQSDFAFLLQVCRPGLWTTTALFYLMPLGHSINFSSAKFWVGLVYVNGVPQLPWQTFTFGALFAMHSHLFGEVMDIVPDRESGRTTTAVRIGASRTKLLMAVFLGVEVALVTRYFHDRVIGGFLAVGAVWFVADALWLWRNKPHSQKVITLFMWMWNVTAVLLIVWDYMQGPLRGLFIEPF